MATFEVEFRTPLNIIVKVDGSDGVDDDFSAGEVAHDIVSTYLETLGTQTGDSRIVSVEASIDGQGADEVKEVTDGDD